jgi:alkanesulfonate monooxygenase
MLEEQLAIITGMWKTPVGETFSYAGTHHSVVDSPGLPKPAQQPGPPIVIGGGGPKRTPRLAATYAAEYNLPFAPIEFFTKQCDRVRAACEKVDRDPASMVFSAGQVLCCGRDEAEIARRAKSIGREVAELRQNGLAGTPDEVTAKIRTFADAGAARMYLQVLDVDDLDHLALVADEVLPNV